MRNLTPLRAAALALALAACGRNDDVAGAALDDVPDAASLTLEAQGGAAEGLALGGVASGAAALTLAETPSSDDDLARAREKIAAVNEAVRTVFEQVAEVAEAAGAPAPGEAVVYGPVARCVVASACDAGGTATLRLRLLRAVRGARGFSLEARVGDEWRPVAAGWLRRGERARRGAGRVAVDLDALRAAAPAYPGRGQLLGGFASGPVAKALHYRLVDFTPDPARWDAATAAYRGFKTPAGATRVRVAEIGDLYGAVGSDTELGFAHVGWHPAVGGRAFAVVANYTAAGAPHGDVPATDAGAPQYFFGRACYAAGAPTTAVYKEWFLCPRGVAPRACVAAQGGVGTAVVGAAEATWQSACAAAVEPPELGEPEAPPAGTPEDGSGEAGEAEDELVPETPPATVADVTP